MHRKTMKLAGEQHLHIEDHSIESLMLALHAAHTAGYGVMDCESYDDGYKTRYQLLLRKYVMETDEEYALRLREQELEEERKQGLEALAKKQHRYEQYLKLKEEFGHE